METMHNNAHIQIKKTHYIYDMYLYIYMINDMYIYIYTHNYIHSYSATGTLIT